MKKLTLLFFFISPLFSFSQSFTSAEALTYLLQATNNKYYIDSSVLKHVAFLNTAQLTLNCVNENQSISFSDNEQLFLIDLNNDNTLELIFSGWCTPYPSTQVFSLKGNYLEQTI